MDNFMGEYELVVQQMKALFLDKIYREQGLVSVLTDKVNEYDSDVQEYLKELFNKQSIDIETTLALMDEVANSVLEVQNTGNLIRAVIESGQIVKYADEVVEYTEEAPIEGEEVVEYVEEVPVEGEEVVEYVEEVPVEGEEVVEYVEEVPVEGEEVVEYVEEVPVEGEEVVEYVEEVPVEGEEVVEYVEEVPVEGEEVVEYVEEVPVEGEEVVEYVEEVPVEGEEVVEYVEEVPVEGEEVVEYVEEVPVEEESNNEVTFDSYELVDDAIQKFNKNTHAKAKAILVSNEQYSKLMLSRDTQKALFNSKNKIVHEVASVDDKESTTDNIVDNVVSDVEETYSDKQKQIEELMNKANQLYQDGKLDEAQELYNKISEINSGLDDSN